MVALRRFIGSGNDDERKRDLVVPTGTVLGTDSTQNPDKLLDLVRNQDQDGIKQLRRGGQFAGIKSGSKVKMLSFDSGQNAYKERVFGSGKEVWLIKESLFAE
jgi:hypothetical protein